MRDRTAFALLSAGFLFFYLVPLEHPAVRRALVEGFLLAREYARHHVLTCLVPAFFIAGALSTFLSGAAVLKYLGPQAPRLVSYGVASVSGTVLSVCSCTVLPLFAGIYRQGAGIGPATAFLYSGPAINVLAIVLTARVLGWRLGLARALGAVLFSVVIGLAMSALFPERRAEAPAASFLEAERSARRQAALMAAMVLLLIFAAWGRPQGGRGFFMEVWRIHWQLAGACLALIALMLWRWFSADEIDAWLRSTWYFARMILPLLFAGVLAAGFLFGMPPGGQGIVPHGAVARLVGGNGPVANLVASVVGALMYFATLTEVPILQGLLGAGMGQGPALALLLAGPALSLPNMLVIRSVMGTRRTLAYVGLVVAMSTLAGLLYGGMA